MMQAINILIIDTDPVIENAVLLLREFSSGLDIFLLECPFQAQQLLESKQFDLIMLTEKLCSKVEHQSFFQFLRTYSQTESVYIIFLAEKDGQMRSRKAVYNQGFHDFIQKPFSVDEIILIIKRKSDYIRNLNSKHKYEVKNYLLEKGHFKHHSSLYQIYKDNHCLNLTRMEYRCLAYLLTNSERVLSPQQLIQNIWKESQRKFFISDNNLRSLIHKLRKKIEPNLTHPVYLVNSKQGGYIFYPNTVLAVSIERNHKD